VSGASVCTMVAAICLLNKSVERRHICTELLRDAGVNYWIITLPSLVGLHQIGYLIIFKKSVKNVQEWLTCDEHNGCLTWRPMYIYDNISLNSSKNGKCFRQNLQRYENTHFLHTHNVSQWLHKQATMLRYTYIACFDSPPLRTSLFLFLYLLLLHPLV